MNDNVGILKISRLIAFGRLIRLRLDKKSETELFRIFLMISLGVHFVFFVVQGIEFLRNRQSLIEEWSIDADLLVDATSGAPADSALPNSVKGEEAKVSERMLPQLPKQFAVEGGATGPKEKTFTEQDEKAPADQKDSKDLSKTNDAPDEKNRIKKEDALRRLALEKLRNDSKLAKKTQAPSADSTKLKDSSKNVAAANTGATAGTVSASEANRYKARIQAAVRRNYSIPDTLKFRTVEPVVLAIELSQSGQLTWSSVEESSGDKYFDSLAFDALKASTPLPPPPEGLVNQRILLKFSP
jgi:TonB family protein